MLTAPSLVAVAVMTVGAGTALLTVAFAVVDASLLRPLPYAEGDRLVEVWSLDNRSGVRLPRLDTRMLPLLDDIPDVFRATAAYEFEGVTATGSGPAQILAGARVSPNLLAVLGAVPVRGRLFMRDDISDGPGAAAIISESLWRSRFGGRHDILGSPLRIDRTSHRIVGVLPSTWRFPESSTQVWRPLDLSPARHSTAEVIGILAQGVTSSEADDRLRTLSPAWRSAGLVGPESMLMTAEPLQRRHNRKFAVSLYALLAGAVLLHLIASMNIASLFLARVTSRQRQMAVEAALGATSTDLVLAVLSEVGLVSAIGSGVGIVVAKLSLRAVETLIPTDFTWLAASGAAIDARVLGFAALATLATVVLVGVLPTVRVIQGDVAATLQRTSSAQTSGRAHRPTGMLVAVQLAIAMLMMATGGLLLSSFNRLINVEPGFTVDNLQLLDVQFSDDKDHNPAIRTAVLDDVRQRVLALPGVTHVSYATGVPPFAGGLSFDIHPEADGGPPVSGFAGLELPSGYVTSDYFQTMGIPLVAGRSFRPDDPADVIIVNDVLAKRVWGDQAPVGRRFRVGADMPWHVVVGVARDVKQHGLDDAVGAGMEVYYPIQAPTFATLMVRTRATSDMTLVKDEVLRTFARRDPDLPVLNAQTMSQRLHESLSRQRFLAGAASVLAGVGLFLGAVGVFSSTSFWVVGQWRELAVRAAVGARPAQLLTLVLVRIGNTALWGTMLGICVALACNSLLASLLFQISPSDPVVYASAILLLWATVLSAASLPAWRASEIDPATTLRRE
jgi:predicted permease